MARGKLYIRFPAIPDFLEATAERRAHTDGVSTIRREFTSGESADLPARYNRG